jgi:hypothetical protein
VFSNDLYPYIQREPSPKMRLHLSGGLTFDIDHPDDLVVSLQSVEILLPREGENFREAVINLSQVLWVEVISPI